MARLNSFTRTSASSAVSTDGVVGGAVAALVGAGAGAGELVVTGGLGCRRVNPITRATIPSAPRAATASAKVFQRWPEIGGEADGGVAASGISYRAAGIGAGGGDGRGGAAGLSVPSVRGRESSAFIEPVS